MRKKILTLTIAEQYLADSDSVELDSYSCIEDSAAAALAKFKGGLDLSGLRSLSETAAQNLADHKRALDLGGLKRLSHEAAYALRKHKGPLGLSGLTSLSDAAAKHLSEYAGSVYLRGLDKIGAHAAAVLAANRDVMFPFHLRPEAADGALEAPGEVHCTERAGIRHNELKALQIVLPVNRRPVYLLRKQPKVLKRIKALIVESMEKCEAAVDRTALERLESFINTPPKPCASYHFPLPASLIESHDNGDWDQVTSILYEWAGRELKMIDATYVDVENLTEACNECVPFTSSIFRDRRYVKEDDLDDCRLQWRCIGDVVVITMTDQTGQYEIPPHELSDLFNRALPPEYTMVYFDRGVNGLYVLMETEGMERRLWNVLEGH